jgi:Zn-finger nucleic acid-binding protein
MSDPYRDPPASPYRAPVKPSYPCPRCEAGLIGTELAGVRLDLCDRCTGTFVTAETLRAVVEEPAVLMELRALAPRGGNAWAERGRVYVKCPVCETLMNRRQYASGAQVVVDWCKHHGVWFDAGELSKVLDFVATGGLERALVRDPAAAREAAYRAHAAGEEQRFRHPSSTYEVRDARGLREWVSDVLWALE